MSYELGVDLGTTYTAAAIQRGGRTSVVELGNRAASIPSVIFLREDETILTGEAANRRGVTEPGRIAREFKRRVGDPTPILVGGTPWSAESLSAKLLRWVVDHVAEREGGPPERIAVTHPANWGPYKQDLLSQAIRIADLDNVVTLTEPEAAAIHYASQERVETGSIVGVFDLGGGTFDAAMLRKTAEGFEILGSPEGIERLGGIDFDEAVFSHVVESLGGAVGELDPSDPAVTAAVARLRADCIDAKEALSGDTEVTIPVVLPQLQTEVRLTRGEFEGMIRPSLQDSLAAMRRAVRGADVDVDDVSVILLVGGSSRIPLVGQLVAGELGRPVAVDAHPKHSIALGAARFASESDHSAAPAAPAAVPETPSEPVAPAAAVAAAAAAPPPAEVTEPAPPEPAAPDPAGAAPAPAGATPAPPPTPPAAETVELTGDGGGGPGRGVLVGAGLAVVAVIVIAVLVLTGGGDGDGGEIAEPGDGGTTTAAPDTTDPPATTAAPATTLPPETTTTTIPETTTTEFVCAGICAVVDEVVPDGDEVIVTWTPINYPPGSPDVNADFHAHFYWDIYDANQVGGNWEALGATSVGEWQLTDARPFPTRDSVVSLANRPEGADQLCVTPADREHRVVDPNNFDCFDVVGITG